VLAYVLTGLLMLLSAFIMYKLKLSTEHSRLFVMVIYGIVTIVSGLLYGKIKEKRRLFNGAFIGLLYFMVLLLVSLVVNKGLTDSLQSNIISMIICVAGGSIGGIIS
jgi:putative membrane protein (TIGR04086 family)